MEECPKCKGAVVMEYENEYTTTQEYNRDGVRFEKKHYNKNCCNKFEFNKSIAEEDRNFLLYLTISKNQKQMELQLNIIC